MTVVTTKEWTQSNNCKRRISKGGLDWLPVFGIHGTRVKTKREGMADVLFTRGKAVGNPPSGGDRERASWQRPPMTPSPHRVRLICASMEPLPGQLSWPRSGYSLSSVMPRRQKAGLHP